MCLILLTQGSVYYPHVIAGETVTGDKLSPWPNCYPAPLEHLKACHLSSLGKGGFNQRVLRWPRETKQGLRKDCGPVSSLVAHNRKHQLKQA